MVLLHWLSRVDPMVLWWTGALLTPVLTALWPCASGVRCGRS